MNQKGLAPILLIIVLCLVGLYIFLQYNKSATTKSTSNSGNPYQDLKVGLKKAFEK